MFPLPAKSRKPPRVVHRSWRGGQKIADDGAGTSTLKLHLEQHLVGTRTCATSLFPNAAVGTPCVCKTADPDYTIVEVRFARFAGGVGPSDQAESVARGTFSPGCIEYDVAGGEKDFW